MVLVLRPEDGKVMSVSRKKVLCHEEIYATFDATKGQAPVANFEAFKINLDNVKGEVEGLNKIGEFKKLYNIPDHVLSVKLLDDYRRNPEFNEASPADPPRKMIEAILPAILPQSKVQGENPVELIDALNSDLLMEEIGRVKENLKKLDAEDGKAEAILRALRRLEEELANEAPRKGCLKRKKKPRKAEIDVGNIVSAERTKTIAWRLSDSEKDTPESPARKMLKRKVKRLKEGEGASSAKSIAVGDKVKILTKRFGTAYEKDRKKFTKGFVKGILGNIYEVLWD